MQLGPKRLQPDCHAHPDHVVNRTPKGRHHDHHDDTDRQRRQRRGAARRARGADEAPEAAKFKWRVDCEWVNGTHSRSTIEGFYGLGGEQSHKNEFTFDADHPEMFASEDHGATPVEIVLVGLAGCLTAGVAAVAQKRKIQLRSVTARSRATWTSGASSASTRTSATASTASRCTYEIDADASPEDIKAIVAQSQKRSAVYDIITNPTNVTSRSADPPSRASGRAPPVRTTVVVIGAGHAGLAMSRCLTERSIDHVVLERGEVANTWRTERWDSLRLADAELAEPAARAIATRATIRTAS